MTRAYEHPYEHTPTDGPDAGVICCLPRMYEAYGAEGAGGIYIWSPSRESYVWTPGVTMQDWFDGKVPTP